MSRIFISYNRESADAAGNLANDIEKLNHTVWLDQKLGGGQKWWEQILAKIRKSDLFIFLLNPEALESAACKLEYGYASDIGKPILPVLVSDEVSIDTLPPELSQIQFVDYRKRDHVAALDLAGAFAILPPPGPLPDPLPRPPEVPISKIQKLNDRIETTATLSREEQSALLIDVKRIYRDPESTVDGRDLLAKLRKREDLLSVIAEEIDDLLKQKIKKPTGRRRGSKKAGKKKIDTGGDPKKRRSWVRWGVPALTLLVSIPAGWGVAAWIDWCGGPDEEVAMGMGITWAFGLFLSLFLWFKLKRRSGSRKKIADDASISETS